MNRTYSDFEVLGKRTTPFTDEELEELLIDCENSSKLGDCEGRHSIADELLCLQLHLLGFEKSVKAFNKIGKWYA